jgi:hypothetical protein
MTGPAARTARQVALREPQTTSRGSLQGQSRGRQFGAPRGRRAEGRRPGARSRRVDAAGGRDVLLGKHTNRSAALRIEEDDHEKRARRREAKVGRYTLLTRMWNDDVTLERVAKCRRVGVVAGGQVGLRVDSGAAGFSGLSKCGSVWSCPVCAAKIARERGMELEQVLTWAVDQGHTVAMLTATVQHHSGHQLGDTWDAVQYAWSTWTSSRKYTGESHEAYGERLAKWETDRARGWAGSRKRKRPVRAIGWRERYGELGWARAVEVTAMGDNGWHPHLHVVLVFEGQLSGDLVRAAVDEMFPTWQRALRREGFDAQQYGSNADGSQGGALDVRVSTEETAAGLADYFTKFVALEITGAVNKKGRSKGLTPFQLAQAAFIDGDADAYEAWAIWTRVSRGRRQLTWSKRLRELAGLSDERSDEEIADDVIGDADELILPVETWAVVKWEQVQLLLAAEDGGVLGAIRWLDERGLDWIDPPGLAQRHGPPPPLTGP